MAEALLSGAPFAVSDNDYDWLGPGVYFWQSNPKRALSFAKEKCGWLGQDWREAVVGAVIDLGFCLDLATEAGVAEVKKAYQTMLFGPDPSSRTLPANEGMLHKLDCSVIRMLHEIRAAKGVEPFDTVIGVFQEGPPLYESAGFFEKTHIQICVCAASAIRGVFRVPEEDLA